MDPRQMLAPAKDRVCRIAGALILVSGIVAGCGPSQDEIRADIEDVCVRLARDLEKLEAAPAFERLAHAADEAGYEYRMAAYRVTEVSADGPADDLASALSALSDAYRDLEEQLTWRDHASLAATRRAGEAALADALAAAESMAANDCANIGLRVGYFAIAADGAAAAAAALAPTGDYVTDANAACARFADDTFAVRVKVGLRSLIADDTGSTSAGDYLEAIEDQGVITTALDLLVRDLARLVPPAGRETSHDELVNGYMAAREAFGSLGESEEGDLLGVAADQVAEAAALLGVDCGL